MHACVSVCDWRRLLADVPVRSCQCDYHLSGNSHVFECFCVRMPIILADIDKSAHEFNLTQLYMHFQTEHTCLSSSESASAEGCGPASVDDSNPSQDIVLGKDAHASVGTEVHQQKFDESLCRTRTRASKNAQAINLYTYACMHSSD